jgi:hypothetical protein
MEAVVLDSAGRSGFQALQAALGDGGDPARIVAFAFDLLYVDGKNLTNTPLIERKAQLQRLLKNSTKAGALRYSEHVAGHACEIFGRACETGLEGIIQNERMRLTARVARGIGSRPSVPSGRNSLFSGSAQPGAETAQLAPCTWIIAKMPSCVTPVRWAPDSP